MAGNISRHRHKVALLITDMLNTFDFPEARQLLPNEFALKQLKEVFGISTRASSSLKIKKAQLV